MIGNAHLHGALGIADRHPGLNAVVIDLHRAEILIDLVFAWRQLRWTQHCCFGVLQREIETVAVQVVAVRHVPVGQQSAIVSGFRGQREGLVHGQEFRLFVQPRLLSSRCHLGGAKRHR